MIKIDLNNWKRREIFDFFSGVSNPFYMVTFRQDVTALYTYVKANNLSFYYALCYLCSMAINEIDAFSYVIKGSEVYKVDERIPSFTDLKENEEIFHIVTLPLGDSIEDFCRDAKNKSENQTCFINMEEENDNLIYISCIPWVDITGVTNERDLAAADAKDESIPHITWGKYVDRDGKKELGISIEVNHRLIDGVHIGKFAETLNRLINELAK